MVVLGIISVLAGLGIGGMTVFQRTVQIEQSKNDLLSTLRETQNLARNSISSGVKLPAANDSTGVLSTKVDGYAIFFDTDKNDYSLRYCIKTSFLGQSQYDCTGVERASAKQVANNEILIQPQNPAKCKGIFFARLTGDISSMSADIAAPSNTGVCEVKLVQPVGNDFRQIQIDMAANNFSVI